MNIRIKIYVFAVLILMPCLLQSQTLKGILKDNVGRGVAYASIYERQNNQSAATNADGKFEINLSAGKHTLVFRHQQYDTEIINIETPCADSLKIVLKPKTRIWDDAKMQAATEDLAYPIMRKVIAFAPFYFAQVDFYHAQVYKKSVAKVSEISKRMKKAVKKRIKMSDSEIFQTYIREEINDIKYTHPNIFDETAICIYDNFKYDINTDTRFVSNIYDTKTNLINSPLAPNAFKYYNFIFEYSFIENGKKIDKIRIVPRSENPQLLDGYLCVFDGKWNIHSFELAGTSTSANAQVTRCQTFAEISPDVWLPVLDVSNVNLSFLSNKAKILRVVTSTYKLVQPSTINDVSQLFEKSNISEKQRVATLLNKENITDKETYELQKMVEKHAASNKYKRFEVVNDYNINREKVNKNAGFAYWDSVRAMPLSSFERASFIQYDSIVKERGNIKLPLRKKKSPAMRVIFGDEYNLNNRTLLTHSGILSFNLKYNAVDKINYSQSIALDKIFKNGKSISVGGDLGYSFGRKRILWGAEFSYDYLPEIRGTFYAKAGEKTIDFNEFGGVDPFTNTLSSLFLKKNYINFYGKKYVQIGNKIDIINGLQFGIDISYQKRKRLHNTTKFSFFNNNKEFRSNDPINPYIERDSSVLNSNRAFVVDLRISYTPYSYYKKNGRKKEFLYSKFPTFTLGWNRGISGIFNSVSNFDLLTFEINHKYELGVMQYLKYNFRFGYYFNSKKMHFSEFSHFNLGEDDYFFGPFEGLQQLMQTYYSSTNEWFVYANFLYRTPRLLLKRFALKNTHIQENLYFSYLKTPTMNHYSETGYGLSGIMGIVGLGVFFDFEGIKYKFTRVKLSFNIGQ